MKSLSFNDVWYFACSIYEKQHHGHESMHAKMLLVLLVTVLVVQIIIVEWKKIHFKSYQVRSFWKYVKDLIQHKPNCKTVILKYIFQLITLVAMWIIPFGISLRNHWWRFIFLWLVSSCITGLVVRKAVQKPIAGTTPR